MGTTNSKVATVQPAPQQEWQYMIVNDRLELECVGSHVPLLDGTVNVIGCGERDDADANEDDCNNNDNDGGCGNNNNGIPKDDLGVWAGPTSIAEIDCIPCDTAPVQSGCTDKTLRRRDGSEDVSQCSYTVATFTQQQEISSETRVPPIHDEIIVCDNHDFTTTSTKFRTVEVLQQSDNCGEREQSTTTVTSISVLGRNTRTTHLTKCSDGSQHIFECATDKVSDGELNFPAVCLRDEPTHTTVDSVKSNPSRIDSLVLASKNDDALGQNSSYNVGKPSLAATEPSVNSSEIKQTLLILSPCDVDQCFSDRIGDCVSKQSNKLACSKTTFTKSDSSSSCTKTLMNCKGMSFTAPANSDSQVVIGTEDILEVLSTEFRLKSTLCRETKNSDLEFKPLNRIPEDCEGKEKDCVQADGTANNDGNDDDSGGDDDDNDGGEDNNDDDNNDDDDDDDGEDTATRSNYFGVWVGPTTLKKSNVQANRVNIGPTINIYERSISSEASLNSLEEEKDYLDDLQAALVGKYKTIDFCRVSLPFEKRQIHVSACLPLSLDNVDVSNESCLAQDNINSLTEVAKILKNGGFSRVLVEGLAGHGKSTFLMQIGHDWATNKESAFADYKVCFLVQGRSVTSCFLQTLQDQVQQRSSDDLNKKKELLKRALSRAKDKVLLLVDAYDELTDEARSAVDGLIRLELFPSSTVIVTSRPHKCSAILNKFQKRLVLRGFAPAQIEEYSRTFSPGTIQKVFSIMRDKAHILQNLLQSPLFLQFFCSVADEHQELQIIPSVTALFTAALRKALSRVGVETQKLQDIGFLVRFGKLCVKNLKVDKVTFSEADLIACCKDGSTDTLLGVGVVNLDYDWSCRKTDVCYVVVHKCIMEFLAALYLSTVVETHDSSKFLCTIFNRKQGFQSLLPQFLVGLSAERATVVLKQLPRSLLYAKIFTLCTLAIEMMPLGNPSCLVKYLPESLCLSFNDGYVSVNTIPFSESQYCLASEVTVSSGEDILPNDRQIWPRLLDLLEQEDLPAHELHLELDGTHLPSMDSAYQFFGALYSHSKITTVCITAEKLTQDLSELLCHLRHLKTLKSLCLNIKTLSESKEFLAAANLNKLERLKALTLMYDESSSLSDVQLGTLTEAPATLSTLTLQSVASPTSLAFLAEQLQLQHLTAKVDTSAMNFPKLKKNEKQDGNLQLPKQVTDQLKLTCLHPLFCWLTDRSCCLTTLNLGHSCLKPEDVTALTSCVTQPGCCLNSLVLAECHTAKKEPLGIDLTALAPKTKKWKLLDLSSLKISYQLDRAGIISKLIAFDVSFSTSPGDEDPSANGTSIADLFSIQELHCNLEQAFSSKNAFLRPATPLIRLKVCCPSVQAKQSNLQVFFESVQKLPQLESLDLLCRLCEIASDPGFRSWSKFLSNCSLTSLHLEYVPSPYNDWSLRDTMFKMAQLALQKDVKLTTVTVVAVDIPFSTLWKTYLPDLMTDVRNSFEMHSLKSVSLIQKPDLHEEFLVHLEQWEIKNKYKCNVVSRFECGQAKDRKSIVIQPNIL